MIIKKIVASFVLTISLGVLTFGAIFYFLGDKLLKKNVELKVQEVDSEFKKAFYNQESLLKAILEAIVNDPKLSAALKNHDKQALLSNFGLLFQQLKKNHGLTHLSFHLPNRKNLIRIHLPKISGDLINRRSLIKASESKQMTVGLEQGLTGNITLRIVKPLTENSMVIGFVEVGTEIPYLLNKIKKNLSVNYSILVNKNFLESEKWHGQLEKYPDQSEWDTFKNFVLVGSSQGPLNEGLISSIQRSMKSEDIKGTDYYEIAQGIFWKKYPLFDLEGEKIGFILANGSIAGVLDPLIKILILTGVISLVIVLLVFYSSWKVCHKLKQIHLAATQSAQLSSLGKIASTITHEIANPVVVISMCASQLRTLMDEASFDKQSFSDMLDRIDRMVDRISRINTGMRLASRNGERDPLVPVSIKTIITETLDICFDRLKQENIELRLGQIPDQVINCRPSQISQVLLNLINNSRDAISGNKKWIEIKVEQQQQIVKIQVIDSGSGIPKKIAAKMMTEFFSTKNAHSGTGLGLSISRKIISDHKGKLYYDDSSSNTCFVIELPVSYN